MEHLCLLTIIGGSKKVGRSAIKRDKLQFFSLVFDHGGLNRITVLIFQNFLEYLLTVDHFL